MRSILVVISSAAGHINGMAGRGPGGIGPDGPRSPGKGTGVLYIDPAALICSPIGLYDSTIHGKGTGALYIDPAARFTRLCYISAYKAALHDKNTAATRYVDSSAGFLSLIISDYATPQEEAAGVHINGAAGTAPVVFQHRPFPYDAGPAVHIDQ